MSELNERQELFCQYYATYGFDTFGVGVRSYIKAYSPDQSVPNWYNVARASSSQILANVNVSQRISELLEKNGLNDEAVDSQLLFVIRQCSDLSAKVAAIREYNQLKARITKKIETSGKIEVNTIDRTKLTDDELRLLSQIGERVGKPAGTIETPSA